MLNCAETLKLYPSLLHYCCGAQQALKIILCCYPLYTESALLGLDSLSFISVLTSMNRRQTAGCRLLVEITGLRGALEDTVAAARALEERIPLPSAQVRCTLAQMSKLHFYQEACNVS